MLKNIVNVFIGIVLSSSLFSQDVVLERVAILMDEMYTIDGTAYLEELDNGILQLRLSDDFSTPTGPDVRIFLNNSIAGSGGIEVVNLSDINHFNGALTVNMPGSVNIDDYQYIVFFCFQFQQLWASGEWSASTPPGGGFECEDSDVTLSNGTATIDICSTDGGADILTFVNTLDLAPTTNYAYLLTDENETLQQVITGDNFNFEGTSINEQRIYGIHYDGDLLPSIGSNRTATTASGCFTHSSNLEYVEITKNACPTFDCILSNTFTTSGSSLIDICPSDGNSDIVPLLNSLNENPGDHYAYLITDSDQILQDVVYSSSYDFEGTTESEQRVYGIHFDGDLNPVFGSVRQQTTASGCFSHSNNDNFLTVSKNACPPDFICETNSTETSNGNTVDICPSDGIGDNIEFINNLDAEVGVHYAYLITDEDEILEEVVLTSEFDFENSGSEVQRVYGIHYDGDLIPQIGQIRTNTTASGCFQHSDEDVYVTITKGACVPEFTCFATTISSENSINTVDICPSDSQDDIITLQNDLSIEAGLHFAYLITDTDQNVIAFSQTNNYNFEGSSDQEERVYGIHFDSDLNVLIGQNRMQTTASGCYEHSSNTEYLSITKNACIPPFECLATSVATTDWATEIDLCPNDGQDDLVELRNNQMIEDQNSYAYLITDENEIVSAYTNESEYNFEGESDETQRVYGVHYEGDLNVLIGQNRNMTTATGCFIHSNSELYFTITKNACPPTYECQTSLTATADWATTIDICPTDGEDDLIELRNNIMVDAGEHYAYLITNADEILQEVVWDSMYNFEGSELNEHRVYGINYDGELDIKLEENRMETTASGCYVHSGDNLFLTITKSACLPVYECQTSLTATTDWATMIDICPTDGENDIVELRNNIMIPVGEHYAYLITNANETLQEVVWDTKYNFEGSELIEQRVYGINYDGDLDIKIGEDRLETTASGCYVHSGDNLYLTITKSACIDEFECIESLTASTAWIINIDICANDGIADEIFIQNNINTEPGEHYAFLLTDTSEVLLEIFFDSIYNFEGLEDDQYRVYGISYSGQLNPAIGEVRKNTTATDCYIHSGDNLFITVNTKVECIVATQELDVDDVINLYPNPSNGLIQIEYKDDIEFIGATIYNSHGLKVMDVLDLDRIEIETSGIYILQIVTEKEKLSKRFVVTR